MRARFEVKNGGVKLEGKSLVCGVNFSLGSRETILITGENGSGKSSLVKAVAGFPAYDFSGEVFLDGENISYLSLEERARRGLFLSYQEPVEIPGLSYAEMLRAAVEARERKIKLADFRLKLSESLKLLGLDPFFAQKKIGSDLSGGEKKKMEVLQILVLEPKVVILDEIDSGLDARAAKKISGVLRNYQEQTKASLVVISHNLRILSDLTISKKYEIVDGVFKRAEDG